MMHPTVSLNDAVILLFSVVAGSLVFECAVVKPIVSVLHLYLFEMRLDLNLVFFQVLYDRLLTTLEQYHKRLENLVMEGNADIMKMKTNF